VIESAYLLDEMDVEIIADGVHLPAPLLQLIYKIKGQWPHRIDHRCHACSRNARRRKHFGRIEKRHKGNCEDGVAKLPDRTAFAGSVATADRLVRTMINIAGVSLTDTIQMITETPARIMGIDATKGSLQVGKDADILIFDEEINISMTMVKGRVVYQN
jgi:N-acetylglucosamine-6-phosphate deacetylase